MRTRGNGSGRRPARVCKSWQCSWGLRRCLFQSFRASAVFSVSLFLLHTAQTWLKYVGNRIDHFDSTKTCTLDLVFCLDLWPPDLDSYLDLGLLKTAIQNGALHVILILRIHYSVLIFRWERNLKLTISLAIHFQVVVNSFYFILFSLLRSLSLILHGHSSLWSQQVTSFSFLYFLFLAGRWSLSSQLFFLFLAGRWSLSSQLSLPSSAL